MSQVSVSANEGGRAVLLPSEVGKGATDKHHRMFHQINGSISFVGLDVLSSPRVAKVDYRTMWGFLHARTAKIIKLFDL
jgi:hypothetical protein